jgi:hypothetical protein
MLTKPAALLFLSLASLPAWSQAPQRPAIETCKVAGRRAAHSTSPKSAR